MGGWVYAKLPVAGKKTVKVERGDFFPKAEPAPPPPAKPAKKKPAAAKKKPAAAKKKPAAEPAKAEVAKDAEPAT